MPVKRRHDKRRATYPPEIIDLQAGLPVPETPEAIDAVTALYFFGAWPELATPEPMARAGEWIDTWTGAPWKQWMWELELNV